MEFSGKIAIVTGASRGIGKATARMFCEEGATAILVSRNEATGEPVAKEFRDEGYHAEFFQADVSIWEEVESLFKHVAAKYGRVDYLINNAGIGSGKQHNTADIPLDLWEEIMHNDLYSVFYCSQFAGKMMVQQEFGKIVNISSGAAFQAGKISSTAYASAKGAVVNMTRTFARDLSPHNVNVNCITPGVINTEMLRAPGVPQEAIAGAVAATPLKRIGNPWEVAKLVKFFCSEDSSFITGQTMDINGGAFFR